mmetsp:Transcript_152655/g.266544  ORF Transcript_152655/g.266544 Transcript_152655/m.266544 type:complete len:373 (+) Transcript_152655:788-1906(+)
MQPKHLWVRIERPFLDVVQVVVPVASLNGLVQRGGGEAVPDSLHVWAHQRLQKCHQAPAVEIVGHAPPIVDLPTQELDHRIRDVVIDIQEVVHLLDADGQVSRRELILDVPAQGAELAPLLDHRMEEAEGEEQLLEHVCALGALQELVCEGRVGADDVVSQPLWGLVRHLHSNLEHGHGERDGGHGREPEPELALHCLWIEVLDSRLESGHPLDAEVAVLEQDPRPSLEAFLDEGLGLAPLPLPKGDSVQLLVHLHCLCKPHELMHGVSSRTEDEDERAGGLGVPIRVCQVEGGYDDVFLPNVVRHKVLDALYHEVRPQAPEDNQFLQSVQARVPCPMEWVAMRLGRLEIFLIVLDVPSNCRSEPLEVRQNI